MRNPKAILVAFVLALLSGAALADEQEVPPETVESAYPGLVAGALASASLGELEPGVLLDMGGEKVTQQQLDEVLAGSPEKLREQLRKNSLLLVQEMATRGLLLRAARQWAREQEAYPADKAEPEIISDYLQDLVSDVAVGDAEIEQFYEGNRDMFGGAELKDIQDALRQFVLKTKRQEKADAHVRSLSGRFEVVISGPWLAEQAVAVRDNPVDKARASGLPTMVDFGADGCQPCEMMAPILKGLSEDYAGRANILFVHVREDPVLATRYGIQSIPLQVFFDKDGKERYRHVGFLPQEEIENKLAELGVR